MKKLIIVGIAVFYLIIFGIVKSHAGKMFYTIPKGVEVLAFIGDPNSLNLIPVRLKSAEDQKILIFHKKSGRGIWAFYLRGFVHDDPIRGKVEIPSNGYFMIKRRILKK